MRNGIDFLNVTNCKLIYKKKKKRKEKMNHPCLLGVISLVIFFFFPIPLNRVSQDWNILENY